VESLTLRAWWNAGLVVAVAAVLQVGCSGAATPPPVDTSTGSQSAAGSSALGAGGQAGNGGLRATGGSGTLPASNGGTNQVGGGANTSTGGANSVGGAIGNNTGGANGPTGGANGSVGGANPGAGGSNGTGGANAPTGGANTTVGGAATGGQNAVTGGANGTVGGSTGVAGASGTDPCAAITCTGGRQCVAGACQCPTGYSFCAGVCLLATSLQTNPSNCGTCGNLCATGATCTAGVCQCPAGQTACGGACVNMQTDPANCGACATSCASGICTAGVCRPVKSCFNKTVISAPMVADFETYDGTMALTGSPSFGWAFNAPAGTAGAVYAGLYSWSDNTGTPLLSMVAPGCNASKWAASNSNTNSTAYGGGLGMWMGCIDASAYLGISFYVQGSAPTGSIKFVMDTEATSSPDTTGFGGGTCTSGCVAPYIVLPVSATWTQVLAPWNQFTAGTANGATVTTTGNNITGLSWNVGLNSTANPPGSTTYVPVPSAYNVNVDNVQFIGNSACATGLSMCNLGCVNTQTSNAHCGACGNACVNAHTCSSGTCVCPSGYTDCGGQCVNMQIDVGNCGACGKPCSGVCTAGSCQASTCAANMPHLNSTSTASASITLGKYWINNNEWGASGATGSQTIWNTCSSGNTIGWGTSWNWSGGSSSQVKSYASAVLGWQWGWKIASSTTGLPVQISANKNVTCGWTFRVPSSQTIDVAYDLFAHSIAMPGTNDNPTDEIMIWLYRSGGAGPIGGTVAAGVSLAGASWDLHQGNNGVWNVYSFVRTTNATTGATLNLMDFLNNLVARGLSSSKYLSSIQAGTEVFTGTGELDTDSYYCTIQ
jgi:hypothetical protein